MAIGISAPKFQGCRVIEHFAGFGITLHDGVGAIGDISQVTEHGAFLTFDDGAVEHAAGADGVDEIGNV